VSKSFPVWPGPIQNNCLSFDQAERHKTPVSAVGTMISVISHYKETIWRDNNGAHLLVSVDIIIKYAKMIFKELVVNKNLFVYDF